MKILVAIANHGTKNLGYMVQLLESYRSMPWDIDIVVLSDAPKDDLGEDVEVLVGTPSSDPWSLPFAHRTLFVERKDRYDLFIYSEDDTLLTEENLSAWLELQPTLPENEILGFLRFEQYEDGALSYCGVHYHYHWNPCTIRKYQGNVFAHYTNDHSALSVLTRKQLEHCIASGGYDVPPHQGRYDMLVSAASDPYTQCGLQRLVCVTRLPEFLLRHLPNVYLDKIGLHEDIFKPQLEMLENIGREGHSGVRLFDPQVRLEVWREAWNKEYYPHMEPLYREVLETEGKRILSVGTGVGMVEQDWIDQGAEVTAVPMDAVIGASAAVRGIRVLEPNLERALESLSGEVFDAVVFHHTLEFIPDPVACLKSLRGFLAPDGVVVVKAANQPGRRLRFKVRKDQYPLTPNTPFATANYHYTKPSIVKGWFRSAGYRPTEKCFKLRDKAARLAPYAFGFMDSLLADAFIQVAKKA